MTISRGFFFTVYFRSFLVLIISAIGYAQVKSIFYGHYPNQTSITIVFAVFFVLFVAFSTKEFLSIDLKQRILFEYVWFLGLKIGKRTQFDSIEKIFFNRNKYVKRTYVMLRLPFLIFDKNHNEFVFDSFLKLRSGEKIRFISRSDKEELIRELLIINQSIKTVVYDNTSGEAVQVR